MGGKGSGGERIGSGRKPKDRKLRVLQGNAGHRALGRAARATAESGAMPVRPARLSERECEVWDRLAREAFEAGTLADRTLESFVMLCRLTVQAEEMLEEIQREGRTYENHFGETKINPLVGQHRQMEQRVDALMARFGLAPFGKPLPETSAKKPAANPWAGIVG